MQMREESDLSLSLGPGWNLLAAESLGELLLRLGHVCLDLIRNPDLGLRLGLSLLINILRSDH